ncbi:type III secretion system chaperone [Bordetella muralis]|uniref:type III secretion system chaperone n=1 Tax=Bordetella muralis TaxID=1649130 RepID=UPI0039EE9093
MSGQLFLRELARLLGAPQPEDSAVLYLTLESDQQVTVSLETSSIETVLLYTELGGAPSGDAFLQDMGHANFLGAGTEGAVLALRPDDPVVCLFKSVPTGVHSPDDFLPLLKTFCEVAVNWQQRLRAY